MLIYSFIQSKHVANLRLYLVHIRREKLSEKHLFQSEKLNFQINMTPLRYNVFCDTLLWYQENFPSKFSRKS